MEANQNEDGAGAGLGNESDIEHFCKCRGEYQSLTGYFVMCESEDDCINGGWLHPECTRDLFQMTQEEIMKLDKWYLKVLFLCNCLRKQVIVMKFCSYTYHLGTHI